MAKRSTRIEVTKVFKDGRTEVNLNNNKMNRKLCEQVVERLATDWNKIKDTDKELNDVQFRCID